MAFAGSGLERCDALRRDARGLARVRPNARFVLFWRGRPLVATQRAALATVPAQKAEDLCAGVEVFLGRHERIAFFARDVSALGDLDGVDGAEGADGAPKTDGRFGAPGAHAHPDLPAQSAFVPLREVMARLNARDGELAAVGRAVLEWHLSHGYCANCGIMTTPEHGGLRRVCAQCQRQHFPRIDPVVIMLVTHGDDVLLGRNRDWPSGLYSLLAGFVDPGETIEAAVRREVWEETGIRTGRVDYVASQPWPFPSSLMIGCRAEATTREITVDPVEIEDAIWICKKDVAAALAGHHATLIPARRGAISRALIEAWLADTLV